ncbi:MAG: hypothetical protein ACJAXJ_003289 [Colwellia sp.]
MLDLAFPAAISPAKLLKLNANVANASELKSIVFIIFLRLMLNQFDWF